MSCMTAPGSHCTTMICTVFGSQGHAHGRQGVHWGQSKSGDVIGSRGLGVLLQTRGGGGCLHGKYHPPLRKHGRGPKSLVKTPVQRPPRTPYLDKAMHACDTRDSKRVGEPSDGDGEGLRMGKSTLSKAALCSISFPFRMYFKWM